jgi:hypothetical protein
MVFPACVRSCTNAVPLDEESPWTAGTKRDPREGVKYFFGDISPAAQTFTIISISDTLHSFADRYEPRQISFVQGGNEQFPALTDDAGIGFIFRVPQHSASIARYQ